jgi:hypothetical protein
MPEFGQTMPIGDKDDYKPFAEGVGSNVNCDGHAGALYVRRDDVVVFITDDAMNEFRKTTQVTNTLRGSIA